MAEQNRTGIGFVNITFGPCWNYVAVIRSFLQNFVAVSVPDHQLADKISLAVSELLENAVKYTSKNEIDVNLRIITENKQIEVTVSNGLTEEQRKTLEKEIKEINTGTPLEAYLNKMRQATTRTDGKSGLGLARIRHDANAELSMEMKDTLVIMKALFDIT